MSIDETQNKNAKYFRQIAWQKKNGKWGTLALITLVYMLIYVACGALSVIYIGGIATILLMGPLALGWAHVTLAVLRDNRLGVNTLFDGFKQYGSALALTLVNSIFVFLWSLLLIVPGIIKAYSYAMSYYILADNPQLTQSEARKRSIEMMKGNKWRLFCLQFSFIGWWILCILTFGILSLWIEPYQQTAVAAFYQSLLQEDGQQLNASNAM